MTAKIFDCFTFFNEVELLELRLEETWDAVDFYVIAESELTFTGQKKPLYYLEHADRFRPYRDKIIHLVINDVPNSNNPFDREHFQRNAVVRGLTAAKDDDFIMISDVDELIRPDSIRAAQALGGYVVFSIPMYQFYFNLQERPIGWTAAYGFTRKYMNRIPNLSIARWDRTTIHAGFPLPELYHVLNDAGWHFTHLGGIDRLQQKFRSYSHNADRWPRAMMQEGALKRHITAGGIVGNFGELAKFVPIDASFPKSIIRREAHFREIGFIKDVYEALGELQVEHRALKQSLAIQFYDDPNPWPTLGGIPPKQFAEMSGLAPPFQSRLDAIKPAKGSLLSAGKRATQSSISQWSLGATLDADAAGALDGRKTGNFRFHTGHEEGPWWMVDLDRVSEITEVHIYNRIFPEAAISRTSRLKIEVAVEPDVWVEMFRKDDDEPIGGADGNPLIWAADRLIFGRFLRISLLGPGTLHLDQVEVFGLAAPANATGGAPSFSSDWFSGNVPAWTSFFAGLGWDPKLPKTVLELGCFEGRASLWILENLLLNSASRLHCVDVFPYEDNPGSYSARHRRNVLTSPRGNMVIRHAMYSYDFLVDFVAKGGKADFIYIDASHRSPEVLEDLVLAFQALNVGGIMICDDYLGGSPDSKAEGVLSTPKMAIDVFMTLFRNRLRIIVGQPLYQLAFTKTADRGRDDPTSRGQ